jgi:hypothetical protein
MPDWRRTLRRVSPSWRHALARSLGGPSPPPVPRARAQAPASPPAGRAHTRDANRVSRVPARGQSIVLVRRRGPPRVANIRHRITCGTSAPSAQRACRTAAARASVPARKPRARGPPPPARMIIPNSIEFVLPHRPVMQQETLRLLQTDGPPPVQYWLVPVGGLSLCLLAVAYYYRSRIPCLTWYGLAVHERGRPAATVPPHQRVSPTDVHFPILVRTLRSRQRAFPAAGRRGARRRVLHAAVACAFVPAVVERARASGAAGDPAADQEGLARPAGDHCAAAGVPPGRGRGAQAQVVQLGGTALNAPPPRHRSRAGRRHPPPD